MRVEPVSRTPLIDDDSNRHQRQKLSKRQTPKKSNHKHQFEDCLFHYWNKHGNLTEKGFEGREDISRGQKCTVCGKERFGYFFEDLFEHTSLTEKYPKLPVYESVGPFA